MRLQNFPGVGFHVLTANHRNEAIIKILDYLEKDKQTINGKEKLLVKQN
jgi:hypothetical protein